MQLIYLRVLQLFHSERKKREEMQTDSKKMISSYWATCGRMLRFYFLLELLPLIKPIRHM